MSYYQRLKDAFASQPVFTAAEVRRLFRRASSGYVSLLLHYLAKRRQIFRIRNGVYSFSSDAAVVGFGFQPFYYGLQDALSQHGLWEQETNPVVITVRKVRTGVRVFEGGNFVIRRISRKLFFGFETRKYGEFWIPVSTPEKTLIDLVYFRQHIPADVINEFKRVMDRKKLSSYLEKCPDGLAKKVTKVLRLKKR